MMKSMVSGIVMWLVLSTVLSNEREDPLCFLPRQNIVFTIVKFHVSVLPAYIVFKPS